MILTIQRSIWKSKRKDHIKLEQQAMCEVRHSAAKEKKVHIQGSHSVGSVAVEIRYWSNLTFCG